MRGAAARPRVRGAEADAPSRLTQGVAGDQAGPTGRVGLIMLPVTRERRLKERKL